MSAESSSQNAQVPTAAEIYRIAGFTAALLFTWTSWKAYDPPAIALALLVLVATAGLTQKTNLVPVVFLIAFVLMEAFSPPERFVPTQFVLTGSLLGLLIFNARMRAASEPVRRIAPPKRGFWRTMSTPIRQLFRREKPAAPSPPGNMDEAVRLLLSVLLAIVGGWLVLYYAPTEPLMAVRLGLPPGVVVATSVLLPFAVCVLLARTAFWFVDPKRKDPALAEMELNELVWTELRPEMTRVGAFLGSAAAKEPELSTPPDETTGDSPKPAGGRP